MFTASMSLNVMGSGLKTTLPWMEISGRVLVSHLQSPGPLPSVREGRGWQGIQKVSWLGLEAEWVSQGSCSADSKDSKYWSQASLWPR